MYIRDHYVCFNKICKNIYICLKYAENQTHALIASLKNNYKQTWGKTIWKFILISIPYFIVSFILTVFAVIYGFLA